MRYATAAAFRTALEVRLKNESRENGVRLDRLRKLVVFDRFLARLVAVAPERLLLKGGLAMDYRLGYRARTTKDMDLGRSDDQDAVLADLQSAQQHDAGDFFSFVVTRTDALDDADVDGAVRFHVAAELAGRQFDSVVLDVGFGDPEIFAPEILTPPSLVAFADLEPLSVPVLAVEQHIAEKLHAYSRTYHGRPSSRVKDLVDLVLLQAEVSILAGRLLHALQAVFAARGSHALPARFPEPPQEWAGPYRAMAREVGIDTDIKQSSGAVAAFLDPLLNGSVSVDGQWWPKRGEWAS
jgi:predicted nucleotidyltransferase component of viral defense system